MSTHKYKVGQMVDFNPSRPGVPSATRAYKITRLLPHESGERSYRIKTATETFERVARENELVLDTSP